MRTWSALVLAALVSSSCTSAPGQACGSASDCGVGSCSDGVCCASACEGTCMACSQRKTGQPDGTCAAILKDSDPDAECTGDVAACLSDFCDGAGSCRVSAGSTCRAATGACDAAEVCGAEGACPADGFAPTTTICRAQSGACDEAERCSGSSAACPADAPAGAGTTCRAAVGVCDLSEVCDGTSTACPSDAAAPALTVCRAAAGPCDLAEQCSGSNPQCPADTFATSQRSCRAPAGACDAEEFCSGSAATCPADALAAATVTCRAAAGACDVAEQCTGAHPDCPADQTAPSGQVCRATTGACDPEETCTGSNAACPGDVLLAAGAPASCSPYTCGGAASCLTACTSSAQCAAGFACSALQCKPSRLVFITSTARNAAFGGLAGADAICATRAQAANLQGTFKAWLSDAAASPNTRFVHHTGPYVLRTGVIVADDWADLVDGNLDAPIDRNENGALTQDRVWTYTEANGAAAVTGANCSNWTAATNTNAWLGNSGYTVSAWTNSGYDVCTLQLRLYCFQQ